MSNHLCDLCEVYRTRTTESLTSLMALWEGMQVILAPSGFNFFISMQVSGKVGRKIC